MSQSKAELVAPVGIFTASGINVTGVVTASSFEGDGSQLQGVGIGTTGSVNSSGIITASAFYGSGIGLTGITLLGPTNSYETTGIITASAFYGDGIGITNIGGPLSPISYSPGIGQTNVGVSTNIVITFNKPIAAAAATSGIATITLRTDAADGTIVESFDIADSAQLSISGGVLTITPSAEMAELTTHFLVIPAGTLQDTIDTSDNVGITTYSFTTQEVPLFAGELWIWGLGNNGALGLDSTISYSSPVQIPGTQWNKVENNYTATYGIKTDRTLWSWGNNNFGHLGQNDITQYSSPIQIPGTQWSYISPGYLNVSALKTDGTLWAWGYNHFGQLGQNSITYYSSPVQVPGTQWSEVYNRGYPSYTMFAKKTDGTLWSWGQNYNGELGQNNRTQYSSPIQLPGTQWSSNIHIAGSHLIATKTDGTLWVWGNNLNGRLGLNDASYRSSPTQIPGTEWTTNKGDLSGASGTCALKTDGTLWAWGNNGNGQLAIGNLINYSSPKQISGTQWAEGNLMLTNGMFLKTDGTLWVNGRAVYGGNDNNDNVTDRSSPTQIPGTQWYELGGSVYQHIGIKQIIP